MIVTVIYSEHSNGMLGSFFGACVIDRKYPSMYCVQEAVKLWLEEHIKAYDISFEWGTQKVNYTAGGAAPYTSSLKYKTVDSLVQLGEKI